MSFIAGPAAVVMRCEISSGEEGLQQARRWVRELARQSGFDRTEQVSFCTAAQDALEHVIARAYAGCDGLPILLNASNGGGDVVLSIRDYGRKPWRSLRSAQTACTLPEDVYGLWRLYGLVDEVRLDSTPTDGSILTLVKRGRTCS
ncbi:MAG: ATP-binding protein [Acidobacteria bacterium]|nr:ATP-binding protein [Acidobacteriota bacterium]